MDSAFLRGFEKTAILGFAAKVGLAGAKALGKGLTGVGKTFVKRPLTSAFGGLEVATIASKSKDFSKAKPSMTPPGF